MRKIIYIGLISVIMGLGFSTQKTYVDMGLQEERLDSEQEDEQAGNREGIQCEPKGNCLRILETGEFHGDEVTARTGEKWFGIYKIGATYQLSSSIIKVKSIFDSIVDKTGEKTGKLVSVLDKHKPIFLIRNGGFLKRRTVPTVFAGELSLTQRSNPTFRFRRNAYRLRAVLVTRKDGRFKKGLSLVLSQGTKDQVLAHLGGNEFDGYWSVNWVGDLDDDGQLDFYLNLSNHYNVIDKQLFLSSKSKKGKLVGLASSFRTVGC